MRPSSRARRIAAVCASAGLAAGLTWLPAGPASATVQNDVWAAADGNANFTGAGAFDCNLTAGVDSPQSTHATFSSGTATESVDLDQTFTSTADPSDTTRIVGHYKGSLSVSKRHGDLAGFAMGGSGTATLTRALGNASQCHTTGFLSVQAQTQFTETKPGWLYVSRDTGASAETVFIVANPTTMQTVLFELYVGNESKATARGFLSPGTYLVPEWAVVMTVGDGGGMFKSAPGGRTVERTSLASKMTGTFYAAGSALGGTRGTARHYVRLPGSVSCAHRSAKLSWTSRAGQVATASFFVNGKKKATVSSPRAGRSVLLRHLSRTADNKITARLSLKGGGHASASRAYVPCNG